MPPSQAGIALKTVVGYNGNGRNNMVWNADTGMIFLIALNPVTDKQIFCTSSGQVSCPELVQDSRPSFRPSFLAKTIT